jgi:hypothetical protein
MAPARPSVLWPRARGRRWAALGVLALAAACGAPFMDPDAGPPPRGGDAGDVGGPGDAGGGDGGAPDAGPGDAGPATCSADGGGRLPPDGGSLTCSSCATAADCGEQGVCRAVQPSTCRGTCARFSDDCAEGGPAAERFVVEVLADGFACPQRHAAGCAWVHEVEPASGQVSLSLRLLGSDGGVARRYGAVASAVASALRAASTRALWCVEARDLFAGRCVERSPELRVTAAAADAGVLVRWPLLAGHLPPAALHDVVSDVLRAGDAVFRDAGIPWSRSPP